MEHKPIHALFILKRRQDYNDFLPNFRKPEVASGMFSSATHVSRMLLSKLNVVSSHVEIVIDNNCIDRVVTKYRPTHVFIEGYWVVPEKFDILKKLHPTVKWIVRCHSELPFLVQEGIAVEWTYGYIQRGVLVAPNSPRMQSDFRAMISIPSEASEQDFNQFPLLPNYYPLDEVHPLKEHPVGALNVACFGATRPMKNVLSQAAAAIAYADLNGMQLNFHVTAGRIELYGQSMWKNLEAMFKNLTSGHRLVVHQWSGREDFLALCRQMDISLQVSFTESFNLVTADALVSGVPVLTSPEVPFLYPVFADPTSVEDIIDQMDFVMTNRVELQKEHLKFLESYNEESRMIWIKFLDGWELSPEEHDEYARNLLPPAYWTWPFYRICIALKTLWSTIIHFGKAA